MARKKIRRSEGSSSSVKWVSLLVAVLVGLSAALVQNYNHSKPPGVHLNRWWPNHDDDDGDDYSWDLESILPLVAPERRSVRRVLVLSHYNTANFGDRLGVQFVNALVPAGVVVRHAAWVDCPSAASDGSAKMCPSYYGAASDYDVVIVGIGMSVFGRTMTPELNALIDAIPVRIGIFGSQYHDKLDQRAFSALVGKMDVWFARYADDVKRFAPEGSSNAGHTVHLGDWMISACPTAEWFRNAVFEVPANVSDVEVPLDRYIDQLQSARFVRSDRLHPLLCALASAERVAYREQRESYGARSQSGKFEFMLKDVFGDDFVSPGESEFFTVDRAAVAAYKRRVQRNMDGMRFLFDQWFRPPQKNAAPVENPLSSVPDSVWFSASPPTPSGAPPLSVFFSDDGVRERSSELYNEGVGHARAGELADAERLLTEAINIEATLSVAHSNLGKVYKNSKRVAEAEAPVERALASARPGEKARYCWQLAQIRRALGKESSGSDTAASCARL